LGEFADNVLPSSSRPYGGVVADIHIYGAAKTLQYWPESNGYILVDNEVNFKGNNFKPSGLEPTQL